MITAEIPFGIFIECSSRAQLFVFEFVPVSIALVSSRFCSIGVPAVRARLRVLIMLRAPHIFVRLHSDILALLYTGGGRSCRW